MALYKLSDGTSSVDLSPVRGLNIPETRIREHIETKEGPTDTYEWGNAEKYEIPVINITKERKEQLIDWWEDQEVLTFTPDPGDPIQMVIDGVDRPLNMWHHLFDNKYAGMLRLCEVSSQSFSSSHVSVSRSKSCSSFDASQSGSRGSSTSCSAFLLGVSRSSSLGIDVVPDASESCSDIRSCSTFSVSDLFESCSTFSSFIESAYWTASSCDELSSVGTLSSCEDLSSCSLVSSRSSSLGVINLVLASQSCSLDPSSLSQSVSAAGKSCSESAGGIS